MKSEMNLSDEQDELIEDMRAVSSIKGKKFGWIRATILVMVSVAMTTGLAFGVLRLYEKYWRASETEEINLMPTPSPVVQESIPYNPTLQENVLSNETYVNEEGRFSIRPPKDWEVDTSGKMGAPVFFFNPEFSVEGGFQYKSSISVQTGVANGHLLDGYKQFYLLDLKQKLNDLKILEERKLIFSGREAILTKISFTSTELKLKGEILLMVDQDKVYATTALDLESHWDKNETTIETSLYTFNLL